MKKFLIAAVAAVIAFPAYAGGDFPEGHSYVRMSGKVLDPSANGAAATLDAVDFGFTADVVRMCLQAEPSTLQTVYVRIGATVTNVSASLAENFRVPSSTSAVFIGGQTGKYSVGRAMPITGGGDGTDQHCVTAPLEARGVVMHIVSGAATLDVTGFQRRK